MSTPYQRIKGHEQVLDAFGYWPSFHDAEVRSLLLDRNAVLFDKIADARLDLCLHAFEWTRAAQPVFNHHLVQFRFHEVDELTFEGFNHQNAILDFRIAEDARQADVPAGLKLTLVPAFGLSGSFCAAGAEVLMVIACDEKGRPRQKAEHLSWRFTEWRPQHAVWQFGCYGGGRHRVNMGSVPHNRRLSVWRRDRQRACKGMKKQMREKAGLTPATNSTPPQQSRQYHDNLIDPFLMKSSEIQIRFLNAAAAGDVKTVEDMLKNRTKPSSSVLYYAVINGRSQVIQRLLSVTRFTPAGLGKSLCAALRKRKPHIALQLLEHGADPNASEGLDRRPVLLLAIESGLPEIAKELLNRKADPNCHDIPVGAHLLGISVGKTALMAAAERGDVEVTKLLLEAGANPYLKGSKGKTACDLAAKRRDRDKAISVLSDWMQKHPQKKIAQPASAVVKDGRAFGSWADAVAWLEQLTSARSEPHPHSKAVVRFPLALEVARLLTGEGQSNPRKGRAITVYRKALLAFKEKDAQIGGIWFLQFEPLKGAYLCGLQTGDKWKTLKVFQTACANYGISHSVMTRFLRNLDKENPFDLIECDTNAMSGRFTKRLKAPTKVARQLFSFCPFVGEEDGGDLERFARRIKATGYFKLWWD